MPMAHMSTDGCEALSASPEYTFWPSFWIFSQNFKNFGANDISRNLCIGRNLRQFFENAKFSKFLICLTNLLLKTQICIIFCADYGERLKNAMPRCLHCVPIRLRLRLAIVCNISFSESIFEMHFLNRMKPYFGRIFLSGDSSNLIYCQGNRLSHFWENYFFQEILPQARATSKLGSKTASPPGKIWSWK